MTCKPLLIFDFDGVIVDGMSEYWFSSKNACLKILSDQAKDFDFPLNIPNNFKKIRPWVNHGWEMVLLAAECVDPTSHLNILGIEAFSRNYSQESLKALTKWKWTPDALQQALDTSRQESISKDFNYWLQLHKPFSSVIKRINTLKEEGIEIVILTTKSISFTKHLLLSFDISEVQIFGHESGNKPEVLKKLLQKHHIEGFIEDRRTTLETIKKNPTLKSIPCYLATWGYLKPQDLINLSTDIHILDIETLNTSKKNWA